MYLSGTILTLERRLHQLCLTSGDFDSYYAEYQSYATTQPKIERELTKRQVILKLGSPSSPPATSFVLLEGGGALILQNGDNLSVN